MDQILQAQTQIQILQTLTLSLMRFQVPLATRSSWKTRVHQGLRDLKGLQDQRGLKVNLDLKAALLHSGTKRVLHHDIPTYIYIYIREI